MSVYLRYISILSLLILPWAHSLENPDIVKTKILKTYADNVLALNVGIEDGIYKNDHVQLTSNDGFLARGICLKVTELTSHWKLYRVTRPELISEDSSYSIHSVNQSEIPKDLLRYLKEDFSKIYNDLGDKEVNKQLELQQKRILNYDLPIELK